MNTKDMTLAQLETRIHQLERAIESMRQRDESQEDIIESLRGRLNFKKEQCNALRVENAELRGQVSPDKWSHLPEGGEWFTHTISNLDRGTQIVYDDDGVTIGWYADDSHKPQKDWFHSGFRLITRAEAIAIFEKNRKPTVADNATPEPPATPAFKVGDRVKVVGPIDENWHGYSPVLDAYVGQCGEVVSCYYTEFRVRFGLSSWTYPASNLALATDEAGEKPVVDHDAINDELDKAYSNDTQPPMSRERFRQEAAMGAMGAMLASGDERVYPVTGDASENLGKWACSYADNLADAVFGENQ